MSPVKESLGAETGDYEVRLTTSHPTAAGRYAAQFAVITSQRPTHQPGDHSFSKLDAQIRDIYYLIAEKEEILGAADLQIDRLDDEDVIESTEKKDARLLGELTGKSENACRKELYRLYRLQLPHLNAVRDHATELRKALRAARGATFRTEFTKKLGGLR